MNRYTLCGPGTPANLHLKSLKRLKVRGLGGCMLKAMNRDYLDPEASPQRTLIS